MGPDDVGPVSKLISGSWERTYGPLMGVERAAAATAAKHAPERILADLRRPHSESFVSQTFEGAISGYVYAYVSEKVLWLDRLHVDPTAHGAGVADALLRAVLADFIGEPAIFLEVLEGNDRAIAFYLKHGFENAERRTACGGIEGVPTLIMRKILSRA